MKTNKNQKKAIKPSPASWKRERERERELRTANFGKSEEVEAAVRQRKRHREPVQHSDNEIRAIKTRAENETRPAYGTARNDFTPLFLLWCPGLRLRLLLSLAPSSFVSFFFF